VDITLTWLRETYSPEEITLKLYVSTNWMGDLTLEDVCSQPELMAEIPKSLIKAFLKDYSGPVDSDEISLDGLLTLTEFADDDEEGE